MIELISGTPMTKAGTKPKKHSRPGQARIQGHAKPKDTFKVSDCKLWPAPKPAMKHKEVQ